MSEKNRDDHNRWRNKTIAFRVSPEEDSQINRLVALTGLTKQDFITQHLLQHQFVVYGNSRVYKALREELRRLSEELSRLEKASPENDDLMETSKFALQILADMRKDGLNDNKE